MSTIVFVVAVIATKIVIVTVIHTVAAIVVVVVVVAIVVVVAVAVAAIVIATIVILAVSIPCMQWWSHRLLVRHRHSHLKWRLLLRLHDGPHLLLRLLCC